MNVVFIGSGFIAHNHAQELLKMPDVKIVGCTDIDEAKGRAFAEKYGTEFYSSTEDAFEHNKVDIANICLPTYLHKEFTIKCANLGAHVLCEKPIAFTPEDCFEMGEACDRAGVRFMVAQPLRFWPEYMKIKEIIDSGELGDIELVTLGRMSEFPKWSKYYDIPSMSGGGVYEQHLHDLDFALHVFGDVEKVYALGYKNEKGSWHNFISNITFRSGIPVSIYGGEQQSDNYPFRMHFKCIGTKGTIEFNYTEAELLRSDPEISFVKYMNGAEKAENVIIPEGNAYYNENRYFIDHIVSGEPFDIMPVWDSARSIAVTQAVVQSLETGKIISID